MITLEQVEFEALIAEPLASRATAWVQQGSLTVSATGPRALLPGSIVRVDVPGSEIDQHVLYTLVRQREIPNWADLRPQDNGFVSISTGEPVEDFGLVLNAEELVSVGDPLALDLSASTPVVQDVVQDQYYAPLVIPEIIYRQVMVRVGLGFALESELEYDRETVKEILLRPAFELYSKWFPATRVQTLSGQTIPMDVDFPADVIGVRRVSHISNVRRTGGTASGNAFHTMFEMMQASTSGANPFGQYGTPNDYGMMSARYAQAALANTAIDMIRTRKVRVDSVNRVVHVYANTMGAIEIEWTIPVCDWNRVAFNKRDDMRKLLQASVLRGFGEIRGMIKSDIPGEFRYEDMLDESERLEKQVLERWANVARPIVVRG